MVKWLACVVKVSGLLTCLVYFLLNAVNKGTFADDMADRIDLFSIPSGNTKLNAVIFCIIRIKSASSAGM